MDDSRASFFIFWRFDAMDGCCYGQGSPLVASSQSVQRRLPQVTWHHGSAWLENPHSFPNGSNICIYIYIIYIYICMYVEYTAHIRVCVYIYIYICTHTCVCIYIYIVYIYTVFRCPHPNLGFHGLIIAFSVGQRGHHEGWGDSCQP